MSLVEEAARLRVAALFSAGESFLRVHWVAVPEALRARRVNRRGSRPRWEYLERPDAEPLAMTEVRRSILMRP